ncbi:MAG: (2Fe-2S) ferredoxin domain-containing protein [Planctomycetota bacterium]|nr:(2Fe-2S) ferredoxin domain-containing protein [Planctomycetota bacterium]
MPAPKHHILVCTSSRLAGEPNGSCQRRDAGQLIAYVREGVEERGIDDVLISNAGCLQRCAEGPILVVYPENWWYGRVDEAAVDEILDALAEGRPATARLLT